MLSSEMPDAATVLAEMLHPPAWHQDVACPGMGTVAFFAARL